MLTSRPALESARRTAASALAGDGPAPTLNFLGFAVGKASRGEIVAWAAQQKFACEDVDGVALRCAVTTPVAGSAFYRFDGNRLVGIDLIAPATDGDAPKLFQRMREDLTASFGPPHTENVARDLESAPAGRLSSEWRFRDLAVDVSAFHGVSGTRVRMQARSI